MNVLRMRPLSRKRRVTTQSATRVRYAGAQNATPVEETLCNHSKSAQNKFLVKDTVPGRPECGNEHGVCNHCFTYEILQKSHWERT